MGVGASSPTNLGSSLTSELCSLLCSVVVALPEEAAQHSSSLYAKISASKARRFLQLEGYPGTSYISVQAKPKPKPVGNAAFKVRTQEREVNGVMLTRGPGRQSMRLCSMRQLRARIIYLAKGRECALGKGWRPAQPKWSHAMQWSVVPAMSSKQHGIMEFN